MNNILHLIRQTGLMALFAFLFPFTSVAQQADLQPPSFPGGEAALQFYLSENLQYPGNAMEKGIEGEVVVTFNVEKNGVLKGISLAQSVEPSLDAEALRLVQSMPRWVPASKKGKKTKGTVSLSIPFRLTSDNRHMVFDCIPLGAHCDVFDQKLERAHFELKGNLIQHDDGQTEMRSFTGVHLGSLWQLYYAVSDRSHNVYFVGGGTEGALLPNDAKSVFKTVKNYYVRTYGQGYYTNETNFVNYKITNALGEVQISLMPGTPGLGGYAVLLKITDAKAYAEAYREAVDPQSFSADNSPLSPSLSSSIHSGFVILGDKLLSSSIEDARKILEDADYKVTEATPTTLNAQLVIDKQQGSEGTSGIGYTCTASMTVSDVATTVTMTATPEVSKAVDDDIELTILYKQASSKKGQRIYTRGVNTLTRTTSATGTEKLVFKHVTPKKRPRRRK